MRNPRVILLAACCLLFIGIAVAAVVWRAPDTSANADDAGSRWGADYFPNIPLTTHDGEEVRFFDDLIKDKVVAINFIYTTCPDACPMETARLKEVRQVLGDRVGKDVFFYSITIDPEYDTVPVLKEFVDNWNIGQGWKFLTGKEEDIVLLRKKLGVYRRDIQSEDNNDHNLSLVIGNQSTGRWMKRSPYENPYILASQLGSWLHNWKIPSETKRDYADAPQLRSISTGENLFRTRCASCHTIGKGDVDKAGTINIGPDLFNVHKQRDRAWLERWIIEPDKMLQEKDPLAMALYEKYRQVPMPNLRMTMVEVNHLLEHIQEASEEIEKHVKMGHMKMPGTAASHGDHPNADEGSQEDDPHAHH